MKKVGQVFTCNCCCFKDKILRIVFCQSLILIIFLTLSIIVQPGLEKLTLQSASEQIIMTEETYNQWGLIPGETETYIQRDFYINEVSNAKDIVYFGKKPIIKQVGPFSYQEFNDFVDYQFLDNGEKVNYNMWIRYEKLKSSMDPNTKVEVVNLGSMGVWYQLKNARDSQIAIQAFAQLIYGLEDQLYIQAVAQSINFVFLKTQQDFKIILQNCKITNGLQQDQIWNDINYGWSTIGGISTWIKAIQNGNHKSDYFFLKQYFNLKEEQIFALFNNKEIKNFIESSQNLINNQYCNQEKCNNSLLLAKQWTSCELTKNTPKGITPQKSVVFMNETFIGGGFLEISYFYDDYFSKNISNDQKYNVTFDNDWTMKLFNHSQNAKDYFDQKYYNNQFQILNPGNLDFFFSESEKFKKSKDENDLINISNKFGLNGDLAKTRVFYEYVNYIVNEFALKKSQYLGNKGIAAIGTLGSQTLYQLISLLSDYLLPELISQIIFQQLLINKYQCQDFFIQSIDGLDLPKAQQICDQNQIFNNFDASSIRFINLICEQKYGQEYNDFQQKNKQVLTNQQLIQLCDVYQTQQKINYQTFYKNAVNTLKIQYNCKLQYCSNWELAVKQWLNSEITLNVPDILKNNPNFPKSYSVNNWNEQLFPKKIEYLGVLSEFIEKPEIVNMEVEKTRYNFIEAQKLLSFDRLFNGIIQSSVFFISDPQEFMSIFMKSNQPQLQLYIRYIIIEFTFNGFTIRKSANDLLWGYSDPLIETLKNTDVQQGGDPSLDPIINLAGFNFTREQAKTFNQEVFTGKGDVDKTRQYNKIYGRNISIVQGKYFNGSHVIDYYTNPWAEEIQIQGTDSFVNSRKSQFIYITDLYRGSSMNKIDKKVDYQGVQCDVLVAEVSQYQSKYENLNNAKFYQDKYNGLSNMTSVKMLPLFISQPYFMDLKQYDSLQVSQILNENNQQIQPNRDNDTTYVHMEPYSGVALKAAIFLHTHYMLSYEQRELFTYGFKGDVIIPIFLLRRVGGQSDNAIQKQYKLLKLSLVLKKVLFILFIIIASLYLLIISFTIFKYQRKKILGSSQQKLLVKQSQENKQ